MRSMLGLRFSYLVICLTLAFDLAALEIDSMQLPVWVVRNHQILPVSPGFKLQAGDNLKTGEDGRAIVNLDNDRRLKIGNRSQITIMDADATMYEMAEGKLRYLSESSNNQKSVDFRLPYTRVSVRPDADVWLAAHNKQANVTLLKGNITLQHHDKTPIIINTPRTRFLASGSEPGKFNQLNVAELAEQTVETELVNGDGVVSRYGKWIVNLMSTHEKAPLVDQQKRLTRAGYLTELQTVKMNNQNWYRLRTAGFRTREDASSYVDHMRFFMGIPKPWINPR